MVLLPLGLAALPAQAEEMAATLGKQRAASSPVEWEVRESGHPLLGPIRFAVLKKSVETPVGNARVFSRAYLSCQRETRKLAIELANATSADDTRGLKPAATPRLVCSRPIAPWDDKLVQEELLANFEVNDLGDALARGFRAFPLRECVSIRVVQEVTLPSGWSQKTAKVEFDIQPYNRELDSIFATCGELSAYGPTPAVVATAPPRAFPPQAGPAPAPTKAAPPPVPAAIPTPPPRTTVAAAPAKAVIAPPQPPPAPAKPAPENTASWETARVPPSGKTNVRAAPNLQSAIVAQLDPGAVVLVQKTGNEWWKAKPSTGAGFEGYIRQDRLLFK